MSQANATPTGPREANRASKAEQVYADLKEAILAGRLEPGAAIDKPSLCARMAMSRFPVTTAINRLAFEGLVVIEPQHGSFVARISARDVRDVMVLRRAIEVEVTGEAALRMTEDEHDAMDRNLRYSQVASDAIDVTGFYALDIQFHQAVIAGSRIAQASQMLAALRAHLERVRRLLLAPPGRLPTALAEHREIAQALRARDGGRAMRVMSGHLDQTSALLAAVTRANPSHFDTEPAFDP